jgi:hypothetical protein
METKYLGSKASYDGIRYHIHRSHVANAQAEFAMFLMDKAQLHSVREDGGVNLAENATSKLTPMPPEEIVQRACDIAEIAYQAFHNRGWLVETTEPTKVQLDKIIND